MRDSYNQIIGLDEAGLGPLDGPAVFAVVGLPRGIDLRLSRDSKTMTDDERFDAAYEILANEEVRWGRQIAGVAAIDTDGIGPIWDLCYHELLTIANSWGMWSSSRIILDGNRRPKSALGARVECIVKADARYVPVSAASVLAKCWQVAHMDRLDHQYPQYGFRKHHGYATKDHISAIKEYGAVRGVHRASYVQTLARKKGFTLNWRK